MRVISCSLENFASYKNLEFNFDSQGLVLIQGATGSGKSTLCDVIPWVLFGTTAKGGAVNEVLSWPGDQVTKGELRIENRGVEFFITRIRGPKPKDNDLYFTMSCVDERHYRGKDLQDTQKLLSTRLGFDSDMYLAGAYLHEFSQTTQFFTTTAKNRRVICEQLADLSLSKKLITVLTDELKALRNNHVDLTMKVVNDKTKLETLESTLKSTTDRAARWEKDNEHQAELLKAKYEVFETTRESDIAEARRNIQVYKDLMEPAPNIDLYPVCKECGQPKDSLELEEHRRKQAVSDKSKNKIGILSLKIKEIKLRVNPYKDAYNKGTSNPHAAAAHELGASITEVSTQLNAIQIKLDAESQKLSDFELLKEVAADLRGESIKNTIRDIEETTNSLLTNHFDAEIRVQFTVEDADKLDVEIYKDGNSCVYTQLSKGQRCVLKLCFGVSVMKAVANHNGIKFGQIFFDEALDGMDETLKMKAYGLLETLVLEYESVFVVEHSEGLKTMFTKSFKVELIDGKSQIKEA